MEIAATVTDNVIHNVPVSVGQHSGLCSEESLRGIKNINVWLDTLFCFEILKLDTQIDLGVKFGDFKAKQSVKSNVNFMFWNI